ncbi:Mpv17-like protein [Armadillidium nasatum]|uniref:Mpv17-like protein n=1 Tax=Armadillidium nasatum TaxID=96803 RepID=A0A5N5TEE1_9CRUS|nr:Mpv17-like protein [Armadillidium nasatum]
MQAIGRAFIKHPIIGNVIIYGSLYTGSEAFQQFMTKKVLIPEGEEPQPIDKGIITRYAIMGTCVFPHTLYHAYKYLDSKFVGPSLPMALRKLAIDALVITPVNLTIFYTGRKCVLGSRQSYQLQIFGATISSRIRRVLPDRLGVNSLLVQKARLPEESYLVGYLNGL